MKILDKQLSELKKIINNTALSINGPIVNNCMDRFEKYIDFFKNTLSESNVSSKTSILNLIKDYESDKNAYSNDIFEKIPREKYSHIKFLEFQTQSQSSALPPQLSDFENLRILDLSNNYFLENVDEIGNLKSLEALIITFNDFEITLGDYFGEIYKLSEKIGQLKNLSILILVGNRFNRLPKEIGNLFNLTFFIYKDTAGYLEKIPKEIGKLSNLICFDLMSDHLEKLPDEISNLNNLVELNINCISLVNIPNLQKLRSLKNLYVNCDIKEIPEDIWSLIQLIRLTIVSEKINNVHENIGQLENLIELSLNCSSSNLKDG